MSQEAKKKIILIAVLLLVLVALIFVYIFVVLPLMEEEPAPVTPPPYVAPGEGLYNNTMVTIYPQLNQQDINFLEIKNEHGTYAFHKYYDNTMNAEEMRLLGHEGIKPNDALYSVLIAYVYLPVSYQSHAEGSAPMRDQTEEQMRVFGVTEDTCIASYTVGYETESGETAYHTVYIGNATLTSETTYYVALKGRNTVYRYHQEGVENCMLAPVEDYISPVVYQHKDLGKKTVTEIVSNMDMHMFEIATGNFAADKVNTILQVLKNQEVEGLINSYLLEYENAVSGEWEKTSADINRVTNAYTSLYVSFMGDKVVCLSPTNEDLAKYGLGINDDVYMVKAQLSADEDDTFSFRISKLIDGYYYTLSYFYGDDTPFIVRAPQSSLSFLESEGRAVFEWASTDISGLFYEYLLKNEDPYAPGMKSIKVRVQRKNDKTGEIIYSAEEVISIEPNGQGGVIATTSSGLKFESRVNEDGGKENEFTDFYRMLVYFPNPTEMNSMTKEEREAIKADSGSLIFEFIAQDNDNNLFRFSYYQIGTSVNVMIEGANGKIVNGVETWEPSTVEFNTSLSQIDILRVSFQKLLNGEDIRPEDYIY
ncbi:MAG: hypothetical protein E7596_00350 [Ruminococcaceae bacterium]|nr:hypothetical protein [Oscillospiraceae bacterium]